MNILICNLCKAEQVGDQQVLHTICATEKVLQSDWGQSGVTKGWHPFWDLKKKKLKQFRFYRSWNEIIVPRFWARNR